tara:strand:+ start:204 stop:467 length:264 start_codon:yes stop_codon:yes gene_type:complete
MRSPFLCAAALVAGLSGAATADTPVSGEGIEVREQSPEMRECLKEFRKNNGRLFKVDPLKGAIGGMVECELKPAMKKLQVPIRQTRP